MATMSKAAEKSRLTRTVTCLSKTSNSAVSVECCFLYVDWNWPKFLEPSKWE